jgi:hypothetical protein
MKSSILDPHSNNDNYNCQHVKQQVWGSYSVQMNNQDTLYAFHFAEKDQSHQKIIR